MIRSGMVVAALALMAVPLVAQESTEELKKELEHLKLKVDGLEAALDAVNRTREIPASGSVGTDAMAADDSPVMTLFKQTKLSGFVDAGYQFSFNNLNTFGGTTNNSTAPGVAGDGKNPVRVFDNRGNSFYLNAVQLNLEKLATKDMIVGYHLELAAGHDPAIYDVGAVTLQEGWVDLLFPLGNGLNVRIGKMATLTGYEVLESVNDLNYSRSLLFGFAIPFTHTGVHAAYSFGGESNDMFTATLGFINGFNALTSSLFEDNDHGKGMYFQFVAKPIKDLSIVNTVVVANETDTGGGTDDKQYVWDIVVNYTWDKLLLGFNFDWGSKQAAIGGVNRGAISGVAYYVKYQLVDWFAPIVRVEYMSDQQGRIAGLGPVTGADSGTGSRVIEFTLTGEFKIAQQLIFRVEFRHDDSNNHNFVRDGVPARGDNTLGFEVIMPF